MTGFQVIISIISACVSVLTLLGFGTFFKSYWEDRQNEKIEETEEAKRKQKESRQNEVKEAVSEIVNPFTERVEGQIGMITNRLELSEQCDQAILRNALMNLYYSCRDKGYRTEDDSKNYFEMHNAYNAVGGNSFIDSEVSEWFEQIPLKYSYIEEKEDKPKTKTGTTARTTKTKKGGSGLNE